MNKFAKRAAVSVVALAGVGLLAGMWGGPPASGGAMESPRGPQIAGSYYSTITIVDMNGMPIPGAEINALATYDFKGGVSSTDTSDEGGHPLLVSLNSPGHGAWDMDGNTLTTVIISLQYDLNGVHTGASRITATQVFDPQNPNIAAGTWYAELFGLGEDPLGPPRMPSAAALCRAGLLRGDETHGRTTRCDCVRTPLTGVRAFDTVKAAQR